MIVVYKPKIYPPKEVLRSGFTLSIHHKMSRKSMWFKTSSSDIAYMISTVPVWSIIMKK